MANRLLREPVRVVPMVNPSTATQSVRAPLTNALDHGFIAVQNMPHGGSVYQGGRELPPETGRWTDATYTTWVMPIPIGEWGVGVFDPQDRLQRWTVRIAPGETTTVRWTQTVTTTNNGPNLSMSVGADLPTQSVESFDSFMARCPTNTERTRAFQGIRMSFGQGVDSRYNCAASEVDRIGQSTMGGLVNVFRFLDWVKVTQSRMPWRFPTKVESTGTYLDFIRWIASLNLNWRVEMPGNMPEVNGDPGSAYHAVANEDTISLNANSLTNMEADDVMEYASSIIHEIRHTAPGGRVRHNCRSAAIAAAAAASGGRFQGLNSCDPSLSYGGAYAAQYWFLDALKNFSPPGQFSSDNKAFFDWKMEQILRVRICNPT